MLDQPGFLGDPSENVGLARVLRSFFRPVMVRDLQQNPHCSLPFFGIVLCLGQFGDVVRGVTQGDQLFALVRFYRLGQRTVPPGFPTVRQPRQPGR